MSKNNVWKRWSSTLAVAFSITVISLMFSNTAMAQLGTKKQLVTFSAPVEIPGGQVLPTGSYIFRLVDSMVDRNIVQILSKDEKHIYATILAIPNMRLQATDKTVITFEERAAGAPPAVKAWFYPYERWGQEFVYPKVRATQLAQSTNQPVPYVPDATPAPTVQQEIAVLEAAPLREVEPSGQSVAVSEVIEAPPVQVAALEQPSLPRTASNLPLLALVGLLSLGVGISLKAIGNR